MRPLTPRQRIERLEYIIKVLKDFEGDGQYIDLHSTIEEAEKRLYELYKEFGWYKVEIVRGNYTCASYYKGTFEECEEYSQIPFWKQNGCEIKITPL